MLQPRGYHFNCDFWQTHSNSIQRLRSHPMDLEFITKWIHAVHKIKICELSDCGIMVKIIRLLICTKYFSFKISYDTFDIIAPSKSLIKRTHHYIYFQYLLTYSILKSDSPSYIVRHPCKGGRYRNSSNKTVSVRTDFWLRWYFWSWKTVLFSN